MNNEITREEKQVDVKQNEQYDQISDIDALKILGKKYALGQISEENFNLLKSVFLNKEAPNNQKKSLNFDMNYR